MKTLWLIIYFLVLIWSGIDPKDYFTWFLEVLPALIGLMVMVVTYTRFRLTPLAYFLILVHCIILMVGGHYTYAEVPLFDWLRDAFNMTRNNYDKVGHLAQGFIPAVITLEILLRREIITKKGWLAFIVVCICLAISALYELIEGRPPCCQAERQMPSWAPRVISGTPSQIWPLPCLAQF